TTRERKCFLHGFHRIRVPCLTATSISRVAAKLHDVSLIILTPPYPRNATEKRKSRDPYQRSEGESGFLHMHITRGHSERVNVHGHLCNRSTVLLHMCNLLHHTNLTVGVLYLPILTARCEIATKTVLWNRNLVRSVGADVGW